MKIYVLTDGTYDDYGIVCITADEAEAERFYALHSNDDNYLGIEEYDTDNPILKINKQLWMMTFHKDGSIDTRFRRQSNYVPSEYVITGCHIYDYSPMVKEFPQDKWFIKQHEKETGSCRITFYMPAGSTPEERLEYALLIREKALDNWRKTGEIEFPII